MILRHRMCAQLNMFKAPVVYTAYYSEAIVLMLFDLFMSLVTDNRTFARTLLFGNFVLCCKYLIVWELRLC